MDRLVVLGMVVLVAVVTAEVHPLDFEEMVHSEHSGRGDDDMAYAHCKPGYEVAKCTCEPHTDCDGSTIQLNKDGETCVAHNKAGANGVLAVAHCRKFAVTVSSEMEDMPRASCPDGYKLLSCAIHSHVSDSLERFFAKSFKATCKTSRGCTHCAVQARCIRLHEFEEIHNPHAEEEQPESA